MVTCDVVDRVATVTLNRPDRRNALSIEMMEQLLAVLQQVGTDEGVRAVILAAAGPVFCSGHDLSEMKHNDLNEYRHVFDLCTVLMQGMQQMPQPVIAEVQGLATAAGCQLVAACDLAIAAETTAFATPGVKIGLFCTTPMVPLTRAIGRKRALEMLLTGRLVSAREAMEWGLVNRVVAAGGLRGAVRELAQTIASAAQSTVTLGKQAFYTQIDMDQPRAYGYAKEVMAMNAAAPDAQEGIHAFLEKRAPVWRAREMRPDKKKEG